MKLSIILALLSLSSISAYASRSEENIQIFEGIIKTYKPQLDSKLNVSIATSIDENPEVFLLNTFGNFIIGRRVLQEWTPLQLALATCHEVGHVLGQWFDPLYFFAPEGEADYYSGGCFKLYLESEGLDLEKLASHERLVSDSKCDNPLLENCNLIVSVARGLNTTLSGTEVDENNLEPSETLPHDTRVVYSEYPSSNCRALTTINGALGLERPSCWFFPGLIKPPSAAPPAKRRVMIQWGN